MLVYRICAKATFPIAHRYIKNNSVLSYSNVLSAIALSTANIPGTQELLHRLFDTRAHPNLAESAPGLAEAAIAQIPQAITKDSGRPSGAARPEEGNVGNDAGDKEN